VAVTHRAVRHARTVEVPRDTRIALLQPSDRLIDLVGVDEPSSVKAVTPQYICRACRKPILGDTRVSDGVDAWHVGCVR
jgi:hypothetical protein